MGKITKKRLSELRENNVDITFEAEKSVRKGGRISGDLSLSKHWKDSETYQKAIFDETDYSIGAPYPENGIVYYL